MCITLSVIIPIYNAEKYLRKCLDSLICQSMQEMEVICVNDGSKDNSLAILREYEKKDKRIIVVNQQNEGPASARKAGFHASKGKYIALVDADDWIEKDIYSEVIDKMELVDADIGIFNWYINNGVRQTSCISIDKEIVIDDKETIYKLSLAALSGRANPIIKERHDGWPWDKVYKRKLLEQIADDGKLFIDTTRHYDDSYFNIRVFNISQRILLSGKYGYHFRRDNVESMTSRYYDTLPSMQDFLHYNEVGKECGFDELYYKAMNTMIVNLFVTYIVKRHYFHRYNKRKFILQIKEIHNLIKGNYTEECYFPIKEAMKKCNPEWIENRIMRFLVKKHLVSVLTLYICSRVSLLKNRFFPYSAK